MVHDPFAQIYLVGFAVAMALRYPLTRHWRRRRVEQSRSTRTDRLLIALTGIGMGPLPVIAVFTDALTFADYTVPAPLSWLGGVFLVSAIWMFWRSHRDLGTNWSSRPELLVGQTLVTRGIYRRVRHPMYAAHWLWGIGQLLLVHNWIAGPAMIVFFAPLYALRVGREERMMLDRFGDDYRTYIARTGRILPRLHGD